MSVDFLKEYITSISQKYAFEENSEMGYRTEFEQLLSKIFESVPGTNIFHDARSSKGNKPDFIVSKDKVPLLYIEVKDIGISLDRIEKSDQMSRYYGYDNLILSDYLEFRFYRLGIPYGEPIKIAGHDKNSRTITPIPEKFDYLARTLIEFTQSHKEPIRSGKHLAKIMGGKAQRIRDNVRHFFSTDSDKNDELRRVYETIKKLLVHDLGEESFADMYAQTLVYGLFVARYHDSTAETFSRQEARDLIPTINPFLQHFFDHLTGPSFDKRLGYIVDELCEIFQHANIRALVEDYKADADPIIHFYEDFLKEYDANLRKKMGAYYTPIPVVQFIVRSVDEILKKDFGIDRGLASSEIIDYTIETGQDLRKDRRLKLQTSHTLKIPKIQILDPAVGTATFLNETIKFIHQSFQNQVGRWQPYVRDNLLKQLFGFELMMTPYTIAHLKLGMTLRETGIEDFNSRLGVYLTNSLEEGIPIQPDLFSFGLAEAVTEESRLAAEIKSNRPIMVVLGNPPYNVSSSNKSAWIQNLINAYKRGLNEQNINSLSDDYVKFIRFAEHFIEKNGSGIVAMITNNSFINGITHRQMRKHLLETFDDIYILDLHGNSKKKERTPNGGKDQNVFDIQQGVSINIFVKKEGKRDGLGKVYHEDLYGERIDKFETLSETNFKNVKWEELKYSEPYYFFVPKDFGSEDEYIKGFKVDELFIKFGSGIKFRKDNLLVKNHFDRKDVELLLQDMNSIDDSSIYARYNFKDTADWKLSEKRKFFQIVDTMNIQAVSYRPFDFRYTYYPIKTIGDIIPRGDSRRVLMRNFLTNNTGLVFTRANRQISNGYFFVIKTLTDLHILDSAADSTVVAPLYLYHEDGTKTPNFRQEIINKLKIIVGDAPPEDIFDYIYAVLYSPAYREKYKEFLKIDFPKIPYPNDKETFQKLVKLGREVRQLHLLESAKLNDFITTYPNAGSDKVERIGYDAKSSSQGNVYINSSQYFGDIPKVAWDFWIGGYQPAQKWLKDRKGRVLTNPDIEHYQKIIVALTETDRIMNEIDEVFKLS